MIYLIFWVLIDEDLVKFYIAQRAQVKISIQYLTLKYASNVIG